MCVRGGEAGSLRGPRRVFFLFRQGDVNRGARLCDRAVLPSEGERFKRLARAMTDVIHGFIENECVRRDRRGGFTLIEVSKHHSNTAARHRLHFAGGNVQRS